MKLELANFPVKEVRFTRQTSYNTGVLEVNKEKLVELVLEDSNIASATLDVVFPGEKTRIVLVRDVVEPRVKVSGLGCVFPGIFCPPETVGEGRTHRLSGVTVMVSADYTPTILEGIAAENSGLVDMWGPGSQVTPYGSIINIVLAIKLVDGVSEWEAHRSIQSSLFKVARQLAEATRDKVPENVEVFELAEVDSSLPRVVYILGWTGNEPEDRPGPETDAAFYGTPVQSLLPTAIHPNEILDGAVTVSGRCGDGDHATTWAWLNHPVVLELFKEHGKRFNFLGVILQKLHLGSEHNKHVAAACTSQMARLMGADAAIVGIASVGGSNSVDMMLIAQACERKGIKTVVMTPEWGGDQGTDPPLLFYVTETTAIVSVGSHHRELKLPAPTKVIGAERGRLVARNPRDKPVSPWSEITIPRAIWIANGVDFWGELKYTGKEY